MGNRTGLHNCTSAKEHAQNISLYRWGHGIADYYQPIMIILGLMGNFLIFCIMIQKSYRRNSCCNYIIILAVSDSVALFRKLIDLVQIAHGVTYTTSSCGAWVYVALTAMQYSCFLVILMTIDRLVATKYNNKSFKACYCTPKTARIVMAIVLCASLAFNLPHVFLSEAIAGGRYCSTLSSKQWKKFGVSYLMVEIIVNYVIPCILLIVMTWQIIVTLKKNDKLKRKLSEALPQEKGSKCSSNVITFIFTDGLFNYPITVLAETFFKKKQKKCSKIKKTVRKAVSSLNKAYTSDEKLAKQKGKEENIQGAVANVSVGDAKASEVPPEGNRETCTDEEKSETSSQFDSLDSNALDQVEKHFNTESELSDSGPQSIDSGQSNLNGPEGFVDNLGKNACRLRKKGTSDENWLPNTDQQSLDWEERVKGQNNGIVLEVPNKAFEIDYDEPMVTNEYRNYAMAGDKNLTCENPPIENQEEVNMQCVYNRSVSKAKARNDRQLTCLLLLVVFFFIILTFLQHLRYFLYHTDIIDRCKDEYAYAKYYLFYQISNKLFFTNCAVNFFLYVLGSSLFRNNLKGFLCSPFRRCRRGKDERQLEVQAQEQQFNEQFAEQNNLRRDASVQTVSTICIPFDNIPALRDDAVCTRL